MPDNKALSDAAVHDFAVAWFQALDVHAAAEDFHPLLAEEGLELVFPERTMKSHADFDEWLDGIYHTFFDETHNLHEATPTARRPEEADVDILVAWQASWFTPPDAKSKRTSMNAVQRWTVETTDRNPFGLQIRRYQVDRFDYAPGFCRL